MSYKKLIGGKRWTNIINKLGWGGFKKPPIYRENYIKIKIL